MGYLTCRAVLNKHELRMDSTIQQTHFFVHFSCVYTKKITKTAKKAALDVLFWNAMASVGSAFGNALLGHLRIRQGQIDELHTPVFRLETSNLPQGCATGQGAFKSEIVLCLDMALDLAKKYPACGKLFRLRSQRRHTGGDQIGVHEIAATHHAGEIFQGKCGFSCTIRSADNPASGHLFP
mgnify:CR=1 FL=1